MASTGGDNHGRMASSYATIGATLVLAAFSAWYANRQRRSRWLEEEERAHGHEELHSVIDHFKSLILDPETTVEEANKRRTTSYYLKMRESHFKSLVLGVKNLKILVRLRKLEEDRILSHWNKGNQSHRTIVVMCDDTTQNVLDEARRKILEPLNFTHDVETASTWIPKLNFIPVEDMHVTIALPWWWHTIRPGNNELTRKMAQRFKQTLLLKFHYPFQIELERIILLGGKVLVALWRCVGDRTTEDGQVIHDRHGDDIDPMVRLREEIIRCFTTERVGRPLTYQHKMSEISDNKNPPTPKDSTGCTLPSRPDSKMERQHTIEQRTPGMGRPGKSDGFIHTSLCRLPLECLSSHDIELSKIHRLCREASATLSGHRMIVSKYRFLETMGEGGESNPCFRPLYDETVEAPIHHQVGIDGTLIESKKVQAPPTADESLTIGPGRPFFSEADGGSGTNDIDTPAALTSLFDPPVAAGRMPVT